MRGMVFAAGIGSRLKPWTDSHPKALAPVGDRPALDYALTKMEASGVADITVNVHHFADQIEQYLAQRRSDTPVYISDERALLLDTGGGLLKALRERPDVAEARPLPHCTVLHNADIITDFPLQEMIDSHSRSGADATLMVSERHSSRMLWLDTADRRLAGWQNMATGETRPAGFVPTPQMQLQAFGGVHIIDHTRVLPLLEQYDSEVSQGCPFSIITFYLWGLEHGLTINCFTPSGPMHWHDIGTPEKLAAARQTFNNISTRS